LPIGFKNPYELFSVGNKGIIEWEKVDSKIDFKIDSMEFM
jgi:hypothetical protein